MKVDPRYLRYVARSKVNIKVSAGDIPRASTLDCIDCGEPATDYDHRDYTKPVDIEPVCRKCNIQRPEGYPPIDGEEVNVDWITAVPENPTTIPFQFRLTPAEKKALTKLALAESVRLQQDFSRADWIRREIEKAARRKKVWK